jgi:hypothetical protein
VKIAGFTARSGNLVVQSVAVWSPVERPKDPDEFLTLRVLVRRGAEDVLLMEWSQKDSSLEAEVMSDIVPGGVLNYPLREGDVICVEWEKTGTPASVTGMSVEVQATRAGEVGPVTTDIPGTPGGREISRPLFRGGELANDLNRSGLPDLAIPFYLYED